MAVDALWSFYSIDMTKAPIFSFLSCVAPNSSPTLTILIAQVLNRFGSVQAAQQHPLVRKQMGPGFQPREIEPS